MAGLPEPDACAVPRMPRRTIRTRLTVTYTVLVLVVAGLLAVGIYLFMRYAPTYHFAVVPTRNALTLTPVAGAKPARVIMAAARPASLPVWSRAALLNALLIGSLLTLAALVLIASTAGWLITGRMLRPLRDITVAARLAASGQLDHRLALAGPRDELTDLAYTFDGMLAGLERAFQAQQRFAVNASHELRTPLAATQAVLDVALAEPDDHTVTTLARKLRRLNSQSVRIVDTLLDLADVDNASLVTDVVALPELVAQALSEVADEARASRIQIDVQVPDLCVCGEPTLLLQLVRNLIENAVRHNYPGGLVVVEAKELTGGQVQLAIQNTGPVIDADSIPMLTEPFYRGQGRTSQSAHRTSRGLGLALVQAIAAAHGTQLSLSPRDGGGLNVTIELPARPGQPTATALAASSMRVATGAG